jgi:hypothetical protein
VKRVIGFASQNLDFQLIPSTGQISLKFYSKINFTAQIGCVVGTTPLSCPKGQGSFEIKQAT